LKINSGEFYVYHARILKTMKYSFILLIIIFGSTLYGQTDSIEKAILYNKMLSKEIGQVEYSRIATRWSQTMKEIKKYPELPFDKKGQVHYLFLYRFIDLSKEMLFNRILEWLSINYGLFPAYIYADREDGKIIFRNSLSIDYYNSCTYTAVIWIKNEKILMEIINLGYQIYYEGHYSNNDWIPEKTISFSISQFYPVILKNPSEWNSSLNLLISTNVLFNSEKDSLFEYLKSYGTSYEF
jgi:hypothetical protein